MKIICIEGCHGCGKTEIISQLNKNYNVLDEGFLEMPKFTLPPQSFTMEFIWMSKWIERLLKLQINNPSGIYFADRSPFSVLFYAPDGNILEPTINKIINDLKIHADIEIITVYIDVQKDILWNRIQERLKLEPERRKYNEHKYSWMETTLEFYQKNNHLWQYKLENNIDINIVIMELNNIVFECLLTK
ncbi:Hypothetical protein PACV_233 [Pacmanvirus A23]|uniref:Hypothetical protein n=1 Tax=Pacmanvirus A23 TaxID=1932881 RepID=UPI000A09490E|nr:Hypothetical protein B9W72_gp231 [Pacmanvirus A23]SIP85948.1 Hypothetical protein PACV_233 [Pacmanvirus A23]